MHRRHLAMEAEPAQTITAEELDVRLRFMMDDEFCDAGQGSHSRKCDRSLRGSCLTCTLEDVGRSSL